MDGNLLQMAREAGLIFGEPFGMEHLARFAELVRADEREECANVCDALATDVDRCRELQLTEQAWEEAQDACAAAIRARGKQEKV